MNYPVGKISGNVLGSPSRSFPRRARGTVLRDQPKRDAELLGRRELIDETQRILLRFSIKESAELQDTTERAVEMQRNGDSAISLLAAANMCRGSAKARALFAPLFGFTGHYTDPDFMEGLEKVMLGYLNQHIPEQIEQEQEPEAELPL